MANPHKGDVALNVAGKIYTLRYSHAALVKLEQSLDKGLMRIMDELSNPQEMRIGTVVSMLWAGLQKHHPKMTFDDAADLLDEVDGGASGVIDTIGEAFQLAFSAKGSQATNPRMGETDGTGIPVSSNTSPTDLIPTNSGR